jgi:hypothetical protein
MTETTPTSLVEGADPAAASRPEVEDHTAHTPDPEPTPEEDTPAGASDGQTEPGQAEPEEDEIEHEGQKYRIPKALKDSFLRQADYTRKTQAVADAARQVQAAQAEFEREAQANRAALQAEIADHAQVHALKTQLDGWKNVNWEALEAHDRENGTQELASALRRHTMLKDALAEAEATLNEKVTARTTKEKADQQRRDQDNQAEDARLISDGVRHLQAKIPDWSTQAPQVAAFGQERFGFTPQELAAVRDPRMFEVLHLAMLGAKALGQNKTVARVQQQQTIQPAATVGARAAPAPDMARMSTDEWMRARQKQIADRRRKR